MAKVSIYSVIVIGTSAGGLNALSVLLEGLPAEYILPIVIVQHRARDQRDLFEEVLQTKCKMKVKQADEKEKIMPGVVYVAPPDYHLLIEQDKSFSISVDEPVNFSRPSIDVLFESAAAVYKKELAAIILTGSNSDGVSGLDVVRKNGGFTVAQDPKEAQYSFMPLAAIEAGVIKQVWRLEEIKKFLINLTL